MLKNYFCNNYDILYTNVPIENSFWLTQAPNTSKHISRNKGATNKDIQKNRLQQSCLNFCEKGNFCGSWSDYLDNYNIA